MVKLKIKESTIEDVDNLMQIDKKNIERIKSFIIFDNRQYTLKIPKKIAEKVNLDPKKDSVVFEVITYPIEEEKKPELIIRLKQD